jgi:hypothetical protein
MRGGKSFIVLLGVGLALLAYIYFVELNRDPAGTAAAKPKVFTLAADKLEEIEIRAASGEVTTLKKQGTDWQIAQPAGLEIDTAEASSVVSTLESLEMQRTLDENPKSVTEYGLEPARFSVGFRQAGETAMHRLLVGKKTPTGGDLYAKVEGQPKLFLVSAYQETSLNKTPFDLREKTVLKFDRIGVDAVTLEASGSPTLTLARRNTEWRLTKPSDARADFSAVDNLVGRVAQLKMKGLEPVGGAGAKEIPAADLKKYGLDKPQATATIGVGSSHSTLALGTKKDETSIYARDTSRPLVFTVESTILDELKKKADDLRKKDLFEFRSFTAVGFDVSLGKDAMAFAKEKEAPKEPEKGKDDKGKDKGKDAPPAPEAPPVEKWKQIKPASKDADQGKVTDLLTTLSNLRAESFADKALATGEELTVTVRFGDAAKPQIDKVTFRKSGTVVHAMVPGEPGAAVVATADFDRVLTLVKELKELAEKK